MPQSFAASLRRLVEKPVLGALLLVLIAGALLAPRLGTAGLWDPHEVRLLESASEPIGASTLWQAKAYKPRLPLLPLSLGLRYFGLNELGGRTPMLVLGLLTLLAVYALARRLSAETENAGRSSLLSGAVLLSSPLFFLSARHASLTLVPMLSATLAVLGLAMLAWPRAAQRGVDLGLGGLLALVGLSGGLLCSGALVGLVAPLGAVTLTLALAAGPRLAQLLFGALCGGALIVPARQLASVVGLSTGFRLGIAAACFVVAALTILTLRERRGLKLYGLIPLAAVLAVGLLPGLTEIKPSGYSPWFAGVPHWPTSRDTQIDSLLRGLGFFLFPWIGLAPLAIAALFSRSAPAEAPDDAVPATGDAASFAALLPLAWFSLTYLLTTLHCALVGDISFPAAPALALLIGPYLSRLLDDEERGSAAAGLCATLGIVMIGHDYFFAPEQYLSGPLTETLRWPAPLAPVGEVLTLAAVGLGVVFGAGLAARKLWRQRLLWTGIAASLVGAVVAVHALAPALSKHVSYRGLYTRYQKLGGGALALYGVQQASGRIYGQNSVQLYTLPDVMQFLTGKDAARAFVIVGASELGAVDREARIRGLRYFVVDDSNAQFLLLTNRLLPGEDDVNPLKRFIRDSAPQPQTPLHIVFDDKLELIGYDGPQEVSRGDDLVIRLHFRVLSVVSTSYRVFLHFDGMGTRWNGDHLPLGGKLATNYWSPGTYVTDEHRMSISRINNAAGYYQIFTGFWPGGDGPRLKVSAGNHESDQRVRIGVIRVK